MGSECQLSEEKAQRSMIDAARLADELRAELVGTGTRTRRQPNVTADRDTDRQIDKAEENGAHTSHIHTDKINKNL